MKNLKVVYLNLVVISASVICFEIISTRISSVIFVNNYAFIILSLAILGLGTGGIYSYFKIKTDEENIISKTLIRSIFFIGLSFTLFIVAVTELKLINPLIYFFLLFLPFFFAGIVYAQLFKSFAGQSFKLYASDLTGAALGAAASIGIFGLFDAPNAVLFFALLMFASSFSFLGGNVKNNKLIGYYVILFLFFVFLVIYGKDDLLSKVPIGNFPEKDFYHVYPNAEMKSKIIDSRWSIYGRSDLVEYNHQDMVRQLFIDGSAGTQMYRFNGDVNNPDPLLYNLIIRHSTSIPFLHLRDHEKDKLLVIGPGGGKEVLTGLFAGVKNIIGVEVNPDFVDIVEEQKDFNGGIYTDFSNVRIEVKEGRHYIKQTDQKYDLIVMALPSTEQLQSIDNFAMSENYLLTVEAIQDYLNILTPEGRMIFTVHNRWELIRLIVTALYAFEEEGISNQDALNHFVILARDYAPTIVIKKNAYSQGEIAYIKNVTENVPKELPSITFLPFNWNDAANSVENKLLRTVKNNKMSLAQYIHQDQYDISPVHDDSPYFYKVMRGIPQEYMWLLIGVVVFSTLVIVIPYSRIKSNIKKDEKRVLLFPLAVFICIGLGFMILEISLFQKLVLYLGSPTLSLSVLLGSLLIGMGVGSYNGYKIYSHNLKKRLAIISLSIVAAGVPVFLLYPVILNEMLAYGQIIRSLLVFFMMLPFGFLLGIPFPSAIQLLKQSKTERYIPWMYGINGIMSVFGSVLAVVLSMLLGFTPAFFIGLFFYLLVYLFYLKFAH